MSSRFTSRKRMSTVCRSDVVSFTSGRITEEALLNVESDVAWANDNETVLYVEKDPETLLGLTVKRHRVGQDPRHDPTVFTQTDTSFYTGVDKSKSDRFIFIHMESTVSSEWRYAHADDPALEVEGVQTNRLLLASVLGHADFADAQITTRWLEQEAIAA